MLTARDIMTEGLVTLKPEMNVDEAAELLMKKGISGAPVVDPDYHLVGVLSELDCLRAAASGEYHSEESYHTLRVKDWMSRETITVEPDTSIWSVAHIFLTNPIRRLPVVEDGKLCGQVSRRDVLRGLGDLLKQGPHAKRYPDYPEKRIPLESRHRAHPQYRRPEE